MNDALLAPYRERLKSVSPYRVSGTVSEVTGLLVASRGPRLPVGGVCHLEPIYVVLILMLDLLAVRQAPR